ncbi:LPS assembly protein LptD [Amphritea sp. HPY]|uniref:LPS assembly protein LptD n=1 Tax=Amphritea sp. HPY TaxID=3421652 RepID=UPI003D7DD82F
MPFKRRSSYTLTLAIVAATPLFLQPAFSHAGETTVNTAPSDTLWDCSMTKGQDWRCNISPELQQQNEAETAVQSRSKTDNTGSSIAKPTAATAIKQSEPVTVSPTTQAASAPAQAITTDQVSTRPVAASAWNCEADGQGNWVCNEGNRSVTNAKTAATTSGQQNQPIVSTAAVTSNSIQNNVLAQSSHANLDWYPYADSAGKSCKGRYIEPDYQLDETGDALRIDADRSQTQLGGLTTLTGDVLLRQGGHYLRSDKAELDQVTNLASLTGNVQYREPGLLLSGQMAQSNTLSGETVFSGAEYVLHEPEIRGSAERIIRLQDDRIRMEQGSYTSCPPDDNGWRIAAESLVLNPNTGFGEAKHAVLEVGDTPVFYFPYFTFPIDDRRHSGFLFPTVGYSSNDGLELAIPYYFNLAANYDDTLTPVIFSERGLLLENEFRYLNTYGEQTLSTGIMMDDSKAEQDRWLLGLNHNGNQGNWSSQVDFTTVSDNEYFDDLGTSLEVDRQSHLDKKATATYQQDDWSVTATVHSYQTIDDSSKSPYRRLPQLKLKGQKDNLPGQLELGYKASVTRFDRDITDLSGIDRITGDRVHLQPSLSMPMLWPWAHLTPKVSYWYNQYTLDNQVAGKDSNINIGAGIFSLDSGLAFEKQTQFGNSSFTQTLEPRAFLLYVPEEDQDGTPDFDTSEADFSYNGLFRENRFNGLDKIGDSQQLSLGLSSAFYETSGFERARLSIGQAYYFDDRKVQLNGITATDTEKQSNIAAEASWNVNQDLRITLDTELDNSNFGVEENNLKLSYAPSLNQRFSFSYRHREDVRQQTDLSFIWPLATNWNILGHWQEDLENKQTPEALLGLEYSSCCWKVRVAARQWIEDDATASEDSALYLQFILKGLGSLGTGGNSAFYDIIGFKEREETNEY